MKHQINTKIIAQFRPCTDRFENWLKHYETFDGELIDFLQLDNITNTDKVWVAVRMLALNDRFTLEVFAIDCAFAAYAAAAYDAAYVAANAAAAYATTAAAYDAYAAAYAAYAANAAANAAAFSANDAYATERTRQIDALIYLIGGEK